MNSLAENLLTKSFRVLFFLSDGFQWLGKQLLLSDIGIGDNCYCYCCWLFFLLLMVVVGCYFVGAVVVTVVVAEGCSSSLVYSMTGSQWNLMVGEINKYSSVIKMKM